MCLLTSAGVGVVVVSFPPGALLDMREWFVWISSPCGIRLRAFDNNP